MTAFNAGQAVFTISVDKSPFLRGLQDAESALRKSTDSMLAQVDRLGTALTRAGAAMQAGLVRPMLRLGTVIAKQTMEMERLDAVMQASFGNMSFQAGRFAERLSESLGVSESDARDFTARMFNMSRAMGLGERDAYAMSRQVVTLSFNFARFFGVRPEEAFKKLSQGIAGSSRALLGWGIVLRESEVQQKAIELGLGRTTEELTQQELAIARLELLMKRMPPVFDAIERTQGTLADSFSKLDASLEGLKESIGRALAPAMGMLADSMAYVVSLAERLWNMLKFMHPAIGYVVVGVGALGAAFAAVATSVGLAIKAFTWLAPIIGGMVTAVKVIVAALGGPLTAAIAGLITLAAILLALLRDTKEEAAATGRGIAGAGAATGGGFSDEAILGLNTGPGTQVSSSLLGAGLSQGTMRGLAASLQGDPGSMRDRQVSLSEERNELLKVIAANSEQRQVEAPRAYLH